MYDKFLIVTKIKKTIEFIDKTVINFPHQENNLKNRIINTGYDLLELMYLANETKDTKIMREVIVKIKMMDYYLRVSYHKKLISEKKYEKSGGFLLEIYKMLTSWVNTYEESK